MGLLAFGIFLLVVGAALAFAELAPLGGFGAPLMWAGWVCLALGAILIVAHVATGPKRARMAGQRQE